MYFPCLFPCFSMVFHVFFHVFAWFSMFLHVFTMRFPCFSMCFAGFCLLFAYFLVLFCTSVWITGFPQALWFFGGETEPLQNGKHGVNLEGCPLQNPKPGLSLKGALYKMENMTQKWWSPGPRPTQPEGIPSHPLLAQYASPQSHPQP